MAVAGASGARGRIAEVTQAEHDEAVFEQVAIVELSLEKSRARAERAAKALRELDADRHLVEAVERAQEELSAAARRLRQGTYFAVPDAQVDIEVT